jgi:IS30 family transposase
MGYSHFSIEERIAIKHLLAKGASIRQIARELGRSASSVSREIRRNSGEPNAYGDSYTVTRAEKFHRERASKAHNIVQFPLEVIQIIERRIMETWSPEQIAAFYKGQGFPPELVKAITTDNGTEFSDWERIQGELGCQVYFCDTFCAWQKGSNENSNGLLREFFPKGYNLSRYTQAYIDKKVSLINNRPRKCNNWISPAKLMSEAISECCT